MAKRKLIKVEMTYEEEDGTVVVSALEGEQAAEWLQIVNGYVGFQQMRVGVADKRLGAIKWAEKRIPPTA
jgi:hypothetical protein